MLRRIFFASIALFLAACMYGISFAERRILKDDNVTVSFDDPLQNAASEILRLYPGTRSALTNDLGWRTEFRPHVVLIKDSTSFKRAANSDLVIAYAVPQKNLIVIDYSKMNVHPFTLGATLKHELCHLELHHHIASNNLPRWFDEGICQWVTGGLAEIMTAGNRAVLREAALTHRLISLEGLAEGFPGDGRGLLLAYEESKSIVEYIIKEFGVSGVQGILEYMSKGADLETAFHNNLSLSPYELEKRWRSSLEEKTFWISYIGDNIYEILFLSAALMTVYGFLILLKRKKEYKDEDGGEDEEEEEGKI
ncbi:MAG: hypothetical protein HZA15_12585 [Nitrospirae bacterium]|nr:hypothetical protein [Nitrospirota bacterium]